MSHSFCAAVIRAVALGRTWSLLLITSFTRLLLALLLFLRAPRTPPLYLSLDDNKMALRRLLTLTVHCRLMTDVTTVDVETSAVL